MACSAHVSRPGQVLNRQRPGSWAPRAVARDGCRSGRTGCGPGKTWRAGRARHAVGSTAAPSRLLGRNCPHSCRRDGRPRVVEITPGRPDAPLVAEGGAIESEPPVELSDLMKRTGASLQKLDDLARTAKTGLEEINAIAGSIREGKGSLGKFVRDEAAYQSLMSLTHRGERTFSAMEDNLAVLSEPGRCPAILTLAPSSNARRSCTSRARGETAACSGMRNCSNRGAPS